MTNSDKDDAALDALFHAARQQPSAADDAFLARVLGDATALAATHRLRPPVRPAAHRGMFGAMLHEWRAALTLSAAAICGVWLGYFDPVGLDGGSGLELLNAGSATDVDLREGTFGDVLSAMFEEV